MDKRRIGFSVVDIVLVVLIAACILTAVFQNQIRTFFQQEGAVTVELTFLVENVTEKANNYPQAGEKLYLSDSKVLFGELVSVSEQNKTVYQSTENAEESIEVLTLRCKMTAKATVSESGYVVEGVSLKQGAAFSVETKSASFVMVVITKPVEV
jgi:hypothetical protein